MNTKNFPLCPKWKMCFEIIFLLWVNIKRDSEKCKIFSKKNKIKSGGIRKAYINICRKYFMVNLEDVCHGDLWGRATVCHYGQVLPAVPATETVIFLSQDEEDPNKFSSLNSQAKNKVTKWSLKVSTIFMTRYILWKHNLQDLSLGNCLHNITTATLIFLLKHWSIHITTFTSSRSSTINCLRWRLYFYLRPWQSQ